jgi:XRE family transcriptional regulator, regulator of sulfur utilization
MDERLSEDAIVATEEAPRVRIGVRLKSERQRRGLSLRTLAERTGFSASFLSQLELDQTSPSLASLAKLAQTLGVSLSSLLSDVGVGSEVVVVRAKDHGQLRSDWSNATMCSLLPRNADERFSVVLVDLEARGTTGDPGSGLLGREFAFCLRGSLLLHLGEVSHKLGSGDSVFYDAALGPRWSAPRGRAQFLLMTLRIL